MPATTDLDFDPATHTYTLHGRRLPSVTQVLKPLDDYSRVNPAVLAKAADSGTAVHGLTQDLDERHPVVAWEEGIVLYGNEAVYRPYLLAYQAFLHQSSFSVEAVEHRVYSQKHGYAGTLDRVGILNGRRVVLDIKTTSTLMPGVGPQLAAYLQAWNEGQEHRQARGCVALQLRANGSYRIHVYDYRQALPIFMTLLRQYRHGERLKMRGMAEDE